MEHAQRGAAALESNDALTAAGHYTKALIEHPTSPDYFTQRSTALSRLTPARHDLALRDAEYAVLLGRKRQKREKIQAGQQRRVVSLYGLGRCTEALRILDSTLRWRPKDSKKDKMEHDMWDARIMRKLKDRPEKDTSFNEYPETELPTEATLKTWLQGQLKNDGTFKFDEEEDTTAMPKARPAASQHRDATNIVDPQDETDIKTAKAETITQQMHTKPLTIRHDWYQDSNWVTISIYAKRVDKTKLQSEFSDEHVELSFPQPDALEETFTFALNPTFASIDAASSSTKVLGTKVELKLSKKDKGVKWPVLDNKDRPKVTKLPSAWTTKNDEDWDKKAAELTKKQPRKKKEKSDGADSDSDADSEFGGDAVDGFFKKLYAGADDDTRRAMMKSFQESNGTALSTNWSEVGKGKVEEVKGKEN